MSRWFTVPVTVLVEVKVPETLNLENDRQEAADIAETLGNKRIKQCTWGIGNPWAATVSSIEVKYPTEGVGFTDDDNEEEEDDDESER